jgi:hypothetical protein
MKHARLFIALAAAVLTLGAFLKGHSTKKAGNVSTAYYLNGTVWVTLFAGVAYTELGTSYVANKTAKFRTLFAVHPLYAEPNTQHPLYINN